MRTVTNNMLALAILAIYLVASPASGNMAENGYKLVQGVGNAISQSASGLYSHIQGSFQGLMNVKNLLWDSSIIQPGGQNFNLTNIRISNINIPSVQTMAQKPDILTLVVGGGSIQLTTDFSAKVGFMNPTGTFDIKIGQLSFTTSGKLYKPGELPPQPKGLLGYLGRRRRFTFSNPFAGGNPSEVPPPAGPPAPPAAPIQPPPPPPPVQPTQPVVHDPMKKATYVQTFCKADLSQFRYTLRGGPIATVLGVSDLIVEPMVRLGVHFLVCNIAAQKIQQTFDAMPQPVLMGYWRFMTWLKDAPVPPTPPPAQGSGWFGGAPAPPAAPPAAPATTGGFLGFGAKPVEAVPVPPPATTGGFLGFGAKPVEPIPPPPAPTSGGFFGFGGNAAQPVPPPTPAPEAPQPWYKGG